MKYIRTKDGIYARMFPDVEQQISFDHKTIEPAYYSINNEWIAKRDVIKQADTIEELCEWFVIEETGHYSYRDFNTAKGMLKAIHEGGKLFGAIWTDKGLIYVAKMNDKGELELL